MLRSKADDVLIDTDLPTQVLKRSRRRRVVNATLAGVVGVVVVLGGFVGANALFLTGDETDDLGGPGPAAAEWRGLWPQTTQAEAEAAQESLDGGSDEFSWQADPITFVKGYGSRVRHWDETYIVDESVDLEAHPLTLNISNCDLYGVSESEGGACETAAVTIEQLLGRGQGKLWFLTADEPGGPGGPVTPQPGETSEVEEFVAAFMDARLAHSPSARTAFLTPDSDALYETHHDGLYLYDGDDPDGQPEASYFAYEIESITPRGDDPLTYDVVVIIEAGEFEGQTDFTPEILWVGPGLRLDNTRGLVVRSAERGETYTDSEEPRSCQEGSATPVRDCARSFMQTRIDGAGAEFYISDAARGLYDDPDNQLHLYGTPYEDSGNFEFDSYEILGIRKADANGYEVDVRLRVIAEGGPMTILETLFIGPGRNQNGDLQDFVIRGAEGRYES